MKRWQILAAIALLLIFLAGVGYWGFQGANPAAQATLEPPPTVAVSVCDVEKTVTAPGSLVGTRETTLDMPVDGRLAEVSVQAGEVVRAGQVLARLDDRQSYEEAVTSARLALLQARQKLAELPNEALKEAAQLQIDLLAAQKELDRTVRWLTYLTYPEELQDNVVRSARELLQTAQRVYEQAQADLKEKARLPKGSPNRQKAEQALDLARLTRDRALADLNHLLNDATDDALVKAQADVDLEQAKVNEMTSRLKALQHGPAELDRAVLEGAVALAQARLASAETALASIEIKALYDGVVLEVDVTAGESLLKGASILRMRDPQALEVAAQVIEEDFPLVSIGQAVELYFDALPQAQVQGRVERIVPQRLQDDRPLYSVKISLDHVPAGLAAGMSADVSIVLEKVTGALCLPRALVRAGAGSTATVNLWNGHEIEERAIEIGLRGDTNVAILSGLQEGEQVVAK